MSILFINGSPDSKGTTASLAATLLTGKEYETVQLPEHRIYPYGSTLEGDEFDWVLDRMKAADRRCSEDTKKSRPNNAYRFVDFLKFRIKHS